MKYTFELCDGRHNTPASASVFPRDIDPTDIGSMFATANTNIPNDCDDLHIYVTGLTAAMLAVVSVCALRNIALTAYHYNRDTGKYIPQHVF